MKLEGKSVLFIVGFMLRVIYNSQKMYFLKEKCLLKEITSTYIVTS